MQDDTVVFSELVFMGVFFCRECIFPLLDKTARSIGATGFAPSSLYNLWLLLSPQNKRQTRMDDDLLDALHRVGTRSQIYKV